MADPSAASRLFELLNGARVTQAIATATELGIPDLLASGPRSSDDLAAASDTDPGALYRLLRALAAAGVLHEGDGRAFSLTEIGDLLRTDAPASLRDQALNSTRPHYLEAWGNLGHSIRTGENAFTALRGEDVWAWRAHEPAEEAIFNRSMVAVTAGVGPGVAAAYDFGRLRTVVDVGGGSGMLLAAILSRYPALRGIVFDQPQVVNAPAARELLSKAGVLDRCELVGGSFFESVPAGADAYLMKAILHDWEDPDAVRILRTIRAASTPTSALLLVEAVVGLPNEDLLTKFADLNMLVMPGGLERTEAEWRDLLAAGGFGLVEIRPASGRWRLLVTEPSLR
jgi:hypothetical protein